MNKSKKQSLTDRIIATTCGMLVGYVIVVGVISLVILITGL